MRLGRKPAAIPSRVPHLLKSMMVAQPKPAVDWMTAVKSWNSLGNDRYGCCTAAAAFHIVQTWFANNGVDFQPTEAQTLALYSATSDFPKEDDGAVETRVLAYWSATGIPTPDGTDTIAFSALMPTNLNELKLSIEYFGAAYIGINLPISAQTQDVWDVAPGGAVGDGAPGSWGGHAVPLLAYDETGFTCVSWGKPLKMTNAFLKAYCEEAYAVLSHHWLDVAGISPSNIGWQELMADMKAITA
ncbi:hypothetical protein [Paraburkholderia acidisoli]|uniref:Peptidase C1A papain C-terminal domain-containing protein n=1 Tax=Paraburkholderia acidisoli TaxID=2571748 RepID=A0A7Z2JIY7_9BURK|nr:hypothetical protein [Paraburkholderia acidisoli]QGZ66246.1 hypothetical protein FAZ98_31070 [Paraburkholderia acidisoli]